ncbi:MAG: hypothetical protein QOJ66_1804 [Ilumatobacteraceae bacterium]|jgi:hypothetical protein
MAGVEPNAPHRCVSALGFRRVEYVRLLVDEDGTTAEVTGITHRLPRTIRVPLHTAIALIDAGVPKRVETRHLSHVQGDHPPMRRSA